MLDEGKLILSSASLDSVMMTNFAGMSNVNSQSKEKIA